MRVSAIENIIDDVPSSTAVSAIDTRVSSLETSMSSKASTSTVNAIDGRVSSLETFTGNVAGSTSSLNTRVSSLETSFPAGCNTIMAAVTAKGQTPASNSPSDISTAISNISSDIIIIGISVIVLYVDTYGLTVTVDESEVVNSAITTNSSSSPKYTTDYIKITSGSAEYVYIQLFKGYKYFVCGNGKNSNGSEAFFGQTFVPTGSVYMKYNGSSRNYQLSSSSSVALKGWNQVNPLYIVVS